MLKVAFPIGRHNFNITDTCMSLTYKEVLAAGSGSKFSVSDLETLKGDELKMSLPYLGKNPLKPDQACVIWTSLIKEFGSVSQIPEEIIQVIGWISAGIPPEDFQDMRLTDTDTLIAMGEYHGLNISQLTALAEAVRCTWWFKGPEDYTQFDLMFLKHILCAFNRTDVERIHADSYKKAADKLRSLKGCSTDIIEALASLASQKSAFGHPSRWNLWKVGSVGCIIAGLSHQDIRSIPDESMDGLTQDAISCFPPDAIKAMSVGQLSMLRVHVIDELKPEQKKDLSSEQQYALKKAYEQRRRNRNNQGYSIHPQFCLVAEAVLLSMFITADLHLTWAT